MAKIQYGLKITFIFILILFIDSVNRVYRVQLELSKATEGNKNGYVCLIDPLLLLRGDCWAGSLSWERCN